MDSEPTRDALVRAGVELLERDGGTDVGLREIARHAGVSHGAPRRYFPTHRSLLSAIAGVGLREFSHDIRAATGDQRGRAAVELAALAYVTFAVDRPAMFTLMFRHDLLDGGGSHLRDISRPLMEWFRRHLPDDDTDVGAAGLWSSIHGIAVLTTTGALGLTSPGTSPDVLISAAIAAAFR